MATKDSGYYPSPGQQNVSRYPRVGPNYLKYGEQPGWTYSPRDDKYYRDQKSREELERYEEEQGLRSPKPKEPKQPGLGEVILPVAATAGTVAIATEGGKKIPGLFDSTPTPTDPKLDQTLNTTGSTAPAPSNVNGNVQGTAGTPSGLLSANQTPGTGGTAPTTADPGKLPTPNVVSVKPVNPVGSAVMKDGTPGTLMDDGAIVADNGAIQQPNGEITPAEGSNLGQYIQAAGGIAQGYNGYRQWQEGQKIAGAGNIAGGTANIYGAYYGGTTGQTAGKVAGTAVAAANVAQQMANEEGSTADRAAQAKTEALKAGLLYIPVVGQAAYAAIAVGDAITGGKVTSNFAKFMKNKDKFNDRIDFGAEKAIDSKVFHQSTRGVAKMHSGQLMAQSDDPTWQNYVAGMRAQHQEGPPDPEKPFGGKYATWEEAKKAGLQADDLTGVYGNLDAFKPDYAEKAGVPDWSKLTFEQRRAVTQRLIDEDMYSSKKGEVVIGDKEKARRIYEEMSKTNFGAPPAQPGKPGATAPVVPGAPVPPPVPTPPPTGLLATRPPAPLQPGQTPQSTAAAAGSGQPYQPVNPNGTPNGAVATGQLPAGQVDPYGQNRGLLAAMPPRSNSVSPGFDKNGRRIRY